MPAPPVFVSHRRRQQQAEEADGGDGDDAAEDEAYTPYVPLAQRREARFQQLASRGGKEAQTLLDSEALRLEAEAELARKRDKQRRERTLLDNAQEVKRRKAEEDARKTADELRREEEEKLLKELQGQQRKLAGNQELAQGVEYTEIMKATWRPPAYIRARTEEEHDAIREKMGFQVEGEDVPPPAPNFQVRPLVRPAPLDARVTDASPRPVGHETAAAAAQVPQSQEDSQADADPGPGHPDRLLGPRHDWHRLYRFR